MLLNKSFVLSDSSVNGYGFRVLTSGYQMQQYAVNPIGYYMHQREDGVLLRWDNLHVEGDKIIGSPNINMSNPRAQQTIDEINNGFLNAASMGMFVVLEYDDNASNWLPGQTDITVTKWYNRECSVCDVPGNFGSLVLEDAKGNTLSLKNLKGHASRLFNNSSSAKNDCDRAELNELLTLPVRELYLNNKFERLKQLSAVHYQAKMNELVDSYKNK